MKPDIQWGYVVHTIVKRDSSGLEELEKVYGYPLSAYIVKQRLARVSAPQASQST
jgi:hypothetical protein